MRILMLVQLIDEQEWMRGFTVTWVRRLAARVEKLDVITLELGEAELPANVRVQSMGKERSYGRLRILLELYRLVWRTARDVDVIFCHMTPTYTALLAPLTWLLKKPQILWFVHRQVTLKLRIAHLASAAIATASPESYNIAGSKVHILGHGIDTTHFTPAMDNTRHAGHVLSVGRLSTIKNYEQLLQAVALLVQDPAFKNAKVQIAGGQTQEEPDYQAYLLQQVQELALDKRVDFLGTITPQAMPEVYRKAVASVNLAPTGGLDKAVIESMATATPVIFHNRTFLPLVGKDADLLWCKDLAPETIAARLAAVLALDAPAYQALGQRLREAVVREHDLEGLADRLVTLFESVKR